MNDTCVIKCYESAIAKIILMVQSWQWICIIIIHQIKIDFNTVPLLMQNTLVGKNVQCVWFEIAIKISKFAIFSK